MSCVNQTSLFHLPLVFMLNGDQVPGQNFSSNFLFLSGKSLLLPRIRDSMAAFSRTWLEGIELYWSWNLVMLAFLASSLVVLLTESLFAIFKMNGIFISIGIGLALFLLISSAYGIIYYGSEVCFLMKNISKFKDSSLEWIN